MSSNPLLNLNDDEKKRWKEVQEFRFPHASPGRQVTDFFWRQSVEAFRQGAFLCSSILAGITAELARKTRARELGVVDEKDECAEEIAKAIKDSRNMWVHPDLDEIESYVKRKGGSLWSDATMNIASASANLEPLEMTRGLLARLFIETTS